MYLPIPHSAWLMNSFIVGFGIAMVGYNAVVQSLAGKVYRNSLHPSHNVYREFLNAPHTADFLNSPPTEELLHFVKVGWTDLANVYRYCCLALTSYMVLVIWACSSLIFYSIPNHVYLMEHLCSAFPQAHPNITRGTGFWSNVRLLRQVGLPRNLKGAVYDPFKKTWLLVMVGHMQSILLLGGCSAFAVPVIYLIFVPFDNIYHGKTSERQIMFILAYTISAAFLTAAWSTGLAATLTFDEIFRAVSGMGTPQSASGSTDSVGHDSVSKPSARSKHTSLRGIPGLRLLLPQAAENPSSTSVDTLAPPNTSKRNLLRPQFSFTRSLAGESNAEKSRTSFDLEANTSRSHGIFVTTQTVISVEQHKLEIGQDGSDGIPMYPRSKGSSPAPSPTYNGSFLDLKKQVNFGP